MSINWVHNGSKLRSEFAAFVGAKAQQLKCDSKWIVQLLRISCPSLVQLFFHSFLRSFCAARTFSELLHSFSPAFAQFLSS
jgi:uncharacterized membrane protein